MQQKAKKQKSDTRLMLIRGVQDGYEGIITMFHRVSIRHEIVSIAIR